MAGLVPKRRTRREIEQANDLLIRQHEDYLRAWLARGRAAALQCVEDRAQLEEQDEHRFPVRQAV